MEFAVSNYAEGVAQALVGKLGLLLSEEYRLLSGVRGEILHLRDDMAIMNALLRMLSEADDGAVDHFVRAWMKQVRELSYDAEDCIDFFVRRVGAPRRRRVWTLGGAWHLVVTLRARHRLAADIEALRARSVAVAERRVRFGVDGQVLRPSIAFLSSATASSSQPQVLGAANVNPNHELVGIKDQVNRLSEKVKSVEVASDHQPDNTLKVFSIVGFGGLGKTTLAVEVCRKLEEEFTFQAIVSVSQAFQASKDMSGLLLRILQQVQVVKVNHGQNVMQVEDALGDIDDNVTSLTRTLVQRLADKRYLIVIDDVWTISAWDAIRSKLPENNNSSRIIVTTRMETVAKACNPPNAWEEYIYRVKPLEMEDSKKLFVNRVFGPGKTCPDNLVTAMDDILRKCGGLPLAIFSIASLLASYKTPGSLETWQRICNSIGSQMESNPTLEGMRQLITLSYNHLPHHLKTCMMYLSIFPEDCVVKKDRLINRWIAEGLIPEKRGLTMEEVADSYYDDLFSRNMLQPGEVIYDGTAMECRVHDMMLEVVVSKSLEVNFVCLVGSLCGGSSHDVIRRLSIQGDLGSCVEETSMRHVRSLSTFGPEGQGKLLDRLAEFTLLRVLDLQGCKDVEDHHMKHLCRLSLLKFLNLNNTDITVLPSQIGDLQHLHTLWLFDTLLERVPESLINLEKLAHISFKNRRKWWVLLRLPQGLHKMKALEGLLRLELREVDAELAKEIGDMVQLRRLGVVLNCINCWDKPVLQDLARSIGTISSIREISVEDMSENANNMKFLHDFPSPPQLLRHLTMGGKINKFPDWVGTLPHLAHIELWWINMCGDDIFGVLHKLPNLLRITLDRKCCKDQTLVARTTFKFPVLKELALVRNDGSPKTIQFEDGSMEKLEKLAVHFSNGEKILEACRAIGFGRGIEGIQGGGGLGGRRTAGGGRSTAADGGSRIELHLSSRNLISRRQRKMQFRLMVRILTACRRLLPGWLSPESIQGRHLVQNLCLKQ